MSEYSFLKSVQAAVYAALLADGVLMARITGVYDLVPPEATCPYLVLIPIDAVAFDTKTRHGQRITLSIAIVSAEAGLREVEELTAEVMRILSEGTFILDAGECVLLRPGAVQLDFDEVRRLVTARILTQAIVQEAI